MSRFLYAAIFVTLAAGWLMRRKRVARVSNPCQRLPWYQLN